MFPYCTRVGIQLQDLWKLVFSAARGSIDGSWATQMIKSTRVEPEKCLTGEISDCAHPLRIPYTDRLGHEESVTPAL